MSNQPPNQPNGPPQQSQDRGQQQPPQQGTQQQPQQQHRQQQPPQQPPQGPPGGRGRRPSGGSGSDLLQNIGLIAAALAVVGIAFGLTPTVMGSLGDDPVLFGTEEQIEEQKNPYEGVPAEQKEEMQERESAQQKQSLVRTVTGFGPYFGFVLASLVGGLAALRLSSGTRDVVITGAAGALAGAFMFVFLSTLLASFQWASVPQSETESKAAVQYGSLLINSIGIGILSAIGGSGVAFFTDQLGE